MSEGAATSLGAIVVCGRRSGSSQGGTGRGGPKVGTRPKARGCRLGTTSGLGLAGTWLAATSRRGTGTCATSFR